MMGLSASRAQQLLSRGGPALVKSEILSSPSSSQLGTTRSGTAAAAKASAAAAAAAAAADAGSDAAAAAANNGGYATNHYASGAAYHGRHTGPYATAAEAATGGVKAEIGSAAPSIQTRPHGSSAAAVAAAAAAATGGGDSASAGGLYGRDGAAAAAAATAGAAPTHHAARGRPVVSGMGIMVGGGPRIGVSGGADGGEKKFVGAYSPEARRQRIERFLQKREKRVSRELGGVGGGEVLSWFLRFGWVLLASSLFVDCSVQHGRGYVGCNAKFFRAISSLRMCPLEGGTCWCEQHSTSTWIAPLCLIASVFHRPSFPRHILCDFHLGQCHTVLSVQTIKPDDLSVFVTQVWTKMVKYDVRKNFADTRMRVKGRFVKKEDEALLREVMACA